jgi:hypothetical protein
MKTTKLGDSESFYVFFNIGSLSVTKGQNFSVTLDVYTGVNFLVNSIDIQVDSQGVGSLSLGGVNINGLLTKSVTITKPST